MPEDERPRLRFGGRGKKRLAGDEIAWHDLAALIGTSVSKAKWTVTATEFIRWKTWFERKVNERKAEFWYFAQIAFEVHEAARTISGGSFRPLKSFLLEFDTKADAAVPPEPDKEAGVAEDADDYLFSSSEEEVKELSIEEEAKRQLYLVQSKATWFALAGLTGSDGKLITRLPPGAS